MEEHFILRVPQSVADRLDKILNEDPASASDDFLDLAFQGQLLSTNFLALYANFDRELEFAQFYRLSEQAV